SVLIYGLILRAWLSRLDQFRRVRLFGLRLVARAQDELAQRGGLLLRGARLLFKAARGPLEVAPPRARGHAARERHPLFERAPASSAPSAAGSRLSRASSGAPSASETR